MNNFYATVILFIFLGWTYNFPLHSKEINPWDLNINERIINRKNVSQILIEHRIDEYRLVLLVSDRYPYNYKQVLYPVFFRFSNENETNIMMKRISDYLESGQNMSILLNGNVITRVIFHEPYLEIP